MSAKPRIQPVTINLSDERRNTKDYRFGVGVPGQFALASGIDGVAYFLSAENRTFGDVLISKLPHGANGAHSFRVEGSDGSLSGNQYVTPAERQERICDAIDIAAHNRVIDGDMAQVMKREFGFRPATVDIKEGMIESIALQGSVSGPSLHIHMRKAENAKIAGCLARIPGLVVKKGETEGAELVYALDMGLGLRVDILRNAVEALVKSHLLSRPQGEKCQREFNLPAASPSLT